MSTGRRRQSERAAPGLGPGPAGGVKQSVRDIAAAWQKKHIFGPGGAGAGGGGAPLEAFGSRPYREAGCKPTLPPF